MTGFRSRVRFESARGVKFESARTLLEGIDWRMPLRTDAPRLAA